MGDSAAASPEAESFVVIGELSHGVKWLRNGERDLI
jgi:hypothetical protein